MKPEEIEKKRKVVTNLLLESTFDKKNFTTLSNKQLEDMFKIYDKIFFDGQLRRKLKSEGSSLEFQVSASKGHSVAGSCRMIPSGKVCDFVIKISKHMFLEKFRSENETLRANGLLCTNRLECLQIVFEHELVHMIMGLWKVQEQAIQLGRKKSWYGGHGFVFKCLVKERFGQTDIRHNLSSGDISTYLSRDETNLGQTVSFEYQGQTIHGTITKKNPRSALVEVPPNKRFRIGYGSLKKSDVKLPKKTSETSTASTATGLTKNDVTVGQTVSFEYQGKTVVGRLIKKNPKFAVVNVPSLNLTFKVRYILLKKVDAKLEKETKPLTREDFQIGQKVRVRLIKEEFIGTITGLEKYGAIVKDEKGHLIVSLYDRMTKL